MKKALVFQHMNHDHPGRFLDFMAEDHIVPEPVRLWEGQAIPGLKDYDFLFVLGGEQNCWQEAEFPWLAAEKAAIREWVLQRAKPYFGVCLGHQLLCDALGGKVEPAKQSEIGIYDVTLTTEGQTHPLCKGLPQQQRVMQWHQAEATALPPAATLLASSPRTTAQFVSIDTHAVGTQFHCEFSPQTIAGWSSLPHYIAALEKHNGQGAYRQLITEATPLMPAMRQHTCQLYDNLARATGLRK